jgi:hypothetical protein
MSECQKCLWFDILALRQGKNHCTYPVEPREDENGECWYFCLFHADPEKKYRKEQFNK